MTDTTSRPPKRVRVTWRLAPGVSAALWHLAEWQDMIYREHVVLAEVLGRALADLVAERIPAPILPKSIGPSADPVARPLLSLPSGLAELLRGKVLEPPPAHAEAGEE